MDTYCWIHGTFSIPSQWTGEKGEDIVYPGVAAGYRDEQGDHVYHKYYQWVCYVLFLQAGLFYVPRFLWKSVEGGRMQMLVAVSLNHSKKIFQLSTLFRACLSRNS